MTTDEVRAVLAAAEAALASERAEGILKGDANAAFIAAATPAVVAALCGRVLELEDRVWWQADALRAAGTTLKCINDSGLLDVSAPDPRAGDGGTQEPQDALS